MKNRLLFMMAFPALVLLAVAANGETPWESLAQSSGSIEAAAMNAAGEMLIQEQLGFIRVSSAGQAVRQDLPASQRIFLSPSGQIYASLVFEGPKDQPGAAALTIHRTDGSVVWSVSHHFLNEAYPANSGSVVAVARNQSVPENLVYFFSPSGKLVKEMNLPAVGEIQINPSSDRVLINSGTLGLLLFDLQGKRLADLGFSHGFLFSQDGRWVAAFYGPKVILFHDGKATYKGEPSGEIVRGAAFSDDAAHIVLFTDHALVVMENPSGKILMQQHLEVEGQYSFTSVDLTIDAGCTAVGLERDLGGSVVGPERHPDGQIRLYNLDGSVCHQKDVAYQHWNTTTPRVSFSADGKHLVVLTRDEITRAPLGSLCSEGGK